MGLGEDILAAINGLINGEVEVVAGIVATWDTARQMVRTIATDVATAALQTQMNQLNQHYQDVPLSPAVLADMSIRNIDPGFDLANEASYSGINAERFAGLVLDTGESYGIIDALRLWHQGTFLVAPDLNADTSPGQPAYVAGESLAGLYGIDEGELDTVIYYSRVRDQFIPDLKQLSWDTMSTADAITTAVKGLASTDLAEQWFLAAGGMPEQFEILYEAAGDSVGVEHAVALYAHGDITQAQLQAVILQSRINPRFYDVALLANNKWLSPFQIHQALVAGLVSAATATTWMLELGYPADQAAAFAQAGASGGASAVKQATEGQILDDYQAQIITADEATTVLEALGYEASSIPLVLDSIVATRMIAMRNAAISRLRTAFVEFLVDEKTVTSQLTALGMPTAAINAFLTDWTLEQATNVKRLSAAQVGKLLSDGVISPDDAVTRWQQMGYLAEEAELLPYIYPPPATAPTTYPVTTVPPANTTVT